MSGPAPRPPRDAARDQAIDRLRGVAILLVVAYHAGPLSWRLAPYGPDGVLDLPSLGAWWLAVPVLHFGFTGVHLFFVISGFCIHASARGGRALLEPSTRRLLPGGLADYARRRLLRIAPPYWVALLLFGVAVPLACAALGRPAPGGAGVATPSDLLLHALFLHGLSPKTIFSIDPAFWSLATEMEFYAAYPLVAWALFRFGARRVLVGALLLSLGWRAAVLALFAPTVENFMIYRVWLHGFFVPRWYEWILGCWLAEAAGGGALDRPGRWRAAPFAGAALLLLGMLCRAHVTLDKLFADLLFGTGFALLLGGALARERAAGDSEQPGLLARALAAVGRRSYGVYLAHQPILDGEWLRPLPRLLLGAAVSALFALGIERPFERLARRLARRLSRPAAASPAAAAAGQAPDPDEQRG